MPIRVQIPEAFMWLGQPSRYKGTHGGRGSGKSGSYARALLGRAFHRPTRILCCREIQKSIKQSVKQSLDRRIVEMGLQSFFNSTDAEIKGLNGSQFFFAGLRTNPTSIQSMEDIDIAWVEEAQSVSKRSLEILIPTVRKEGSEIWFSWNPSKSTDPVDQLLRKHPPPNAIVREVNYDQNPWFPSTLREEMEYDKRRDKDKYEHIWLGGYVKRSEARVFNNWTVDDFETPANAEFNYGADWGFSIDPTVLIRNFVMGNTLYIDQEAYMIGCPIDKLPRLFDTIENRHARKWVIRADSSRPDTIDYMRSHDYPNIESAIKGPSSVEDGIEFLKKYDIVVHPRCRHTIDELTLYSWKIDPHTSDILPILADKDNHVMDALRYSVEGIRHGYNYALENVA